MISDGWRSIVGKEWAGCVLHNLPFLCSVNQKKTVLQKPIRSIISIQGSAAEWHYYDFMAQADQHPSKCKEFR